MRDANGVSQLYSQPGTAVQPKRCVAEHYREESFRFPKSSVSTRRTLSEPIPISSAIIRFVRQRWFSTSC
ncbi:hypothetical protein TNCV_1428291 [Trichonephila clavipes]|nr:hypothetical protein TNCV_1428291 [Trichonephila clavipes]